MQAQWGGEGERRQCEGVHLAEGMVLERVVVNVKELQARGAPGRVFGDCSGNCVEYWGGNGRRSGGLCKGQVPLVLGAALTFS